MFPCCYGSLAADILYDRRLDQISAKALDLENLVTDVANFADARTSKRIRDVLDKVWFALSTV